MSNEKEQEIKIYTPLDVQKDYEERGGKFSSNIPLYVLLNEIDAVKSERDRLREALEKIKRHTVEGGYVTGHIWSVASEALTRKDGKDGE